MRALIIFEFITLLLVAGCASSKLSMSETATTIKDAPNTKESAADYYVNLAGHKHHDIELYRRKESSATYYQAYFYIKANDSLVCCKASFDTKIPVANAGYKWKDDTTVILRLYSSNYRKMQIVTLWGNWRNNKKTTGIVVGD